MKVSQRRPNIQLASKLRDVQAAGRLGIDSGAAMNALLKDPELAKLLDKPGMAAKFLDLQKNPQAVMEHMKDPEFREVMQKVEAVIGSAKEGS